MYHEKEKKKVFLKFIFDYNWFSGIKIGHHGYQILIITVQKSHIQNSNVLLHI